jgi:phage-related protein
MPPMDKPRKPIAWLHGEIRTPPFSSVARTEAGELLARLQRGESLAMPHSRPMTEIGPRCHELRVKDAGAEWRIMYRTDPDAVLVLDVFTKKTRTTPACAIRNCARRLRAYDTAAKG